jgi:anaerobic ribonucleoside-triphosphate reductase activating protein
MLTLQVANRISCTEAEGPGKRYALWFQGCPLRCPGCCNPEYLPFGGGKAVPFSEIAREIEQSREQNGIEGITLLGGEPFAHSEPAFRMANLAQSLGLTVMVFTGYTIEHLRTTIDPYTANLLAQTDILVDGPYDREQPDRTRRWIGSTNQRIHFLSERYVANDPCWQQRNTLEIRVRGEEVFVNGFPASDAVGLWKGWKRTKPTQPKGGTDARN